MTKSTLLATALFAGMLATPTFAQTDKTPAKPTGKSPVLTEKAGKVSESYDLEAFNPKVIDTTAAPVVIAFGSCNKMNMPQTMWPNVVANNPSLWIWLGDIVYADTTDMRVLAADYKSLKTNPEYKKLRAKAQIVGIYDDHDYGYNDACKYYPKKEGSKKCLLDFLDVPLKSPVRTRAGAYQSYTFGKPGERIKVIVMDLRWFRDSLVPDPSKKRLYYPNMDGTMLGEAQWAWLEKELRNSTADLNILCSSVQILADDHGFEKWGNFPNERKRLLKLIVSTKPKNLLMLSGDRHMAEISKMQIESMPYPLYDFTSSGLTHIRSGTSETNKLRVGDLVIKKNFGVLKIRWHEGNPIVTMETRGHQNELFQEVTVRY